MRLLNLTIRNFLAFGDEEQKIPLTKAGLTLIEGENEDDATVRSNGSGKSTVVEALVWCLYGVSLRGKTGDDVINRFTGNNCIVTLTFTVHEKQWRVRRYRKYKELGSQGLLLERLTLKPGNQMVWVAKGDTRVEDTQTKVDKLIGMSRHTFLSTAVFTRSPAYRFSLLDDDERKKVLDQAMGTELYSAAFKVAKAKDNEYAEALVAVGMRVNTLATTIDHYRALHDSLYEAAKTHRQDKERRIATLVQADADLRSEKQAATSAATRLQPLQGKLMKLRTERSEIGLRFEGTMKCKTCGQPIVDAAAMKAWADKSKKLDAEIDVLVDAVAALKPLVGRVRELDTRIINNKTRLEEVRAEDPPYKKQMEEAAHVLTEKMLEIAEARQEVSNHTKMMKLTKFWCDAFGPRGIRSLLIENALPYLNQRAAEYSATITGGNFTVTFVAQAPNKDGKLKERLVPLVVNASGGDTYESLSDGEKSKADLVIGLALQALASQRADRLNVVFFDEVTDHVDDVGTEAVMSMLTAALAKHESVFVITHQAALKDYFPRRITITKARGQARVTY